MESNRNYEHIIKKLEILAKHCSDMARCNGEPWESDVFILQETMDIVNDYQAVVGQLKRMQEKFETPGKPVYISGLDLYLCPECNRKTKLNHSFCHHCGKKLGWRRSRA